MSVFLLISCDTKVTTILLMITAEVATARINADIKSVLNLL